MITKNPATFVASVGSTVLSALHVVEPLVNTKEKGETAAVTTLNHLLTDPKDLVINISIGSDHDSGNVSVE